ncbi:MAG: DPP IV N-terminal domain-containing protein [Bryobacteraceae bacterium]|nr:DPP IV N-terminal domain-containing protein [Bryobacteraceae bacterium]
MKALRTLALAILLAPALPADAKKPVTIDAVLAAREPAPASPTWSPDGKTFVFTQDRKLHLYDLASQSSRELLPLQTLESAAKPVPQPLAFPWQNRGVKEESLQWFPDSLNLLIAAKGDLFTYSLASKKWEQLTNTDIAEADPKLSPDGKKISFRRNHDLYVLDLAAKAVTRLTHDGSDTLWNAKLDWVYPEELALPSAHWWSPDSSKVAYLQFDVSRQPVYPHGDYTKTAPVFEPQRYPKAGTPNADVRLGVVEAKGGDTRWMNIGETRDHLLARVHWTPSSQELFVQRLNRIQNRLDLLAANVESGAARLVLRESDPHWVNVHDALRFLPDNEFLWASERSGFRHLYLYSVAGELRRQITSGDWEVASLAGIDTQTKQAFYVSTEAGPLERHLYAIGWDGAGKRKLTTQPGSHTVSMSPTAGAYIDSWSNAATPSSRVIHRSDGSRIAVWREPSHTADEQYEILPTEFHTVRTKDGATLHARLIKPAGFAAGRKYPAIVMVYGGPHAQNVRNFWPGLSMDQVYAHRGFVVWQLDNRGTAGRGHAFEARLYRRFGKQELEDQLEGVKHLTSLGFVDPARIGITGWSYGGFMTLTALFHAPDTFKSGIAGAAVTDWRQYDTIYTERYLGLPQENEEGYRLSSPVHYAANLKGQLMLVHNIGDDNVHFSNAMQMIDALEKANKQFDLVIYPQKAHGVTGPVRRHMNEAMLAFFERTLK